MSTTKCQHGDPVYDPEAPLPVSVIYCEQPAIIEVHHTFYPEDEVVSACDQHAPSVELLNIWMRNEMIKKAVLL